MLNINIRVSKHFKNIGDLEVPQCVVRFVL